MDNPFFHDFDTPFATPPFDRIRDEHYAPAFDEGFRREAEEIRAIANNPEPPTFANTLEALEGTGRLLQQVKDVFFNQRAANTNDTIQALARDVSPRFASHRDDIFLNPKLFARVHALHQRIDTLDLAPDQRRLLEETHKNFVRSGANLSPEDQETLRELNQELSSLSVRFGENVLGDTNAFELVIEDEADLAGLPDSVRDATAREAAERDRPGAWVITLHKPSWIPFLQYSERRELRQRVFEAYMHQGNHGDDRDNNALAARIAALRGRRARLLGYEHHAHFRLERCMAETVEGVENLLRRAWPMALARVHREIEELQALIDAEGGDFRLAPWDWWYYAEKLRQQQYNLDEEALRPYFALDNVRQGAFDVAHELFGITFEERHDIPLYHDEMEVFEVKDRDGSHLGLLYTDYFPRDNKRAGAWMTNYRNQWFENGEDVRPHVANVANFSRPSGDRPALLSLDEVMTLFHEFGHGLHGLLSRCRYISQSGTSVPRDFVELPSQLMENWASEPSVLVRYARHWKTDEPIPQHLIEKLGASRHFNQGFATVEYLAASFLDIAWHTQTDDAERDTERFEAEVLERIDMPPEVISRYRSTYFSHIFSLGYSAGYYSYFWAEVLDADAFEAFKEQGLFDQGLAEAYRRNVLEKGDSDKPMDLYRRFRGAEPAIEPLLERRGLLETTAVAGG